MIVNLLSRFPTYYLHLFTNITAIKKNMFLFFSQVWLESRLFASYNQMSMHVFLLRTINKYRRTLDT